MSAAEMQVRDVEGWALGFAGDEEPRVRDIDLAERLGYAQPRDIRKLISRLERAKKIAGVCRRATVARGAVAQPVQEAWLTEEQALLVTTQSDTPKAWEVTKTIVRVFRRAIREQIVLPAPPPAPLATTGAPTLEALWEITTTALVEMKAMRQELAVSGGRGTIGGLQADWITGEVDSLAALRVLLGYHPSPRAAKSWIQGRIAAAAEWSGAGARRRDMPADRYPRVKVCLAQMRSDLEAELARREPVQSPPATSAQTALSFPR